MSGWSATECCCFQHKTAPRSLVGLLLLRLLSASMWWLFGQGLIGLLQNAVVVKVCWHVHILNIAFLQNAVSMRCLFALLSLLLTCGGSSDCVSMRYLFALLSLLLTCVGSSDCQHEVSFCIAVIAVNMC